MTTSRSLQLARPPRRAWRWVNGLTSCLAPVLLGAQPGVAVSRDYTLTTWGTADGLPPFSIRAITQTRDGYLWVGTFHGLCRFDGLRFVTFTMNDTVGLTSDDVTTLYQDAAGDLWVGTANRGLVRYREGRFQPFELAGAGTVNWGVRALCEDAQGTLWVAGSIGLLRRVNDRLEPVEGGHPSFQRPVNDVRLGPENHLWVGTEEGVGDLLQGRWSGRFLRAERAVQQLSWDRDGVLRALCVNRRLASPAPDGVRLEYRTPLSFRVTALCRTRSGTEWQGVFERGVVLADSDRGARLVATTPGLVNVLVEDREGNVWGGVENSGLWCFRPAAVRVLGPELGLENPNVASVEVDAEDTAWIGTLGRGLYTWTSDRFAAVDVSPDAGNVSSVRRTSDGTLWCGTVGGGLFRRSQGGQFELVPGISQSIRAMLEDRQRRLWIATDREGVLRLSSEGELVRLGQAEGLSDDHTVCLAEDFEGAVWIGTDRGLNRLHLGHVSPFYREDGLGADTIRSLLCDSQGTLWIGTLNGGLTRYAGGRFSTLARREGLAGILIEQLLEDRSGHLWMGTEAGLVRAGLGELNACLDGRLRTVHCTVLGVAQGLPEVVCGTGFQPSCAVRGDGQLWFGTGLGIAALDPAEIEGQSLPPRVYIEGVLWDGKPLPDAPLQPVVSLDEPLSVRLGRSRLEFRYAGLSLTAPTKVRFRYRLEPYDADWIEAGGERTATYTGVRPGTYRFRVIAANNEGTWNQRGAAVAVTLLPAWWQTFWFRSLALASVLLLAASAYRYRIRRVRDTERVRLRIARDLHDEVGSNLGSIALLSQAAQAGADAAASADFREIHRVARDTAEAMRDIVWLINPDEDRFERLLLRMKETAGKLLGSTRWRLIAPETLPAERLSTEFKRQVFLIFKEAIHNVARHAQASELDIELRLHRGRIELVVVDHGVGMKPEGPRTGQGLTNMRRRAAEIRGQLSIEPTPEGGTTVRLNAPFR